MSELEKELKRLMDNELTRVGMLLGRAVTAGADHITFTKTEKEWTIIASKEGKIVYREITPVGDLKEDNQ